MLAPSGAPTDTLNAFGADLPGAQDKPEIPGAQDLSIPAQGLGDHPPQSGRSTDISYIPMRHGSLYLVAIMDWHR